LPRRSTKAIHPAGRVSGRDLAFLAVALVGTALSAWRSTKSDADVATVVGALGTLYGSLWVLRHAKDKGWTSLAGVTSLISITAFWLKWVVDANPHPVLQPIPYDSQRAISVYGCFILTLALALHLTVHVSRRPPPGQTESTEDGNPRSSLFAAAMLAVGILALALRFALAQLYGVGVPGITPHFPPGLGSFFGLLYYISVYLPLMCGAALLLVSHSRDVRRPRVLFAMLLLLSYAIAGSVLGYRSYGVTAGLTFLFCMSVNGRPRGDKRAVSSHLVPKVIVLGIVLLVALATISSALGTRSSPGDRDQGLRSAAEFTSNRVGGLDYLSPVVSRIEATRPSLEHVDPQEWNGFVKVQVYGFPDSATNGLSATLVGWLYAIAGYNAVILGGFLAGLGIGFVDIKRVSRSTPQLVREIVHLGMLLAWLNLLLEGTLLVSVRIGIVFMIVGLLIRTPQRRLDPKVRLAQPDAVNASTR
jgi:hypothetical protein